MAFLRAHSVRIVAVLAALVPLLVTHFPDIDWYGALALVGALLGVGEVAQRVEDGKTREALHETSPNDALAELHMQLAEYETNHSQASGR
ncbi:hypothetical protein RCO28_12470 [Streptomyces sp. LHD-70]|uniref:hypothetical protein n=1 Tax=Streptomyces sp. LHD-70 TaxID=3072140 RepID=UPI00280FB60D|nr:hypothetical protein [Streptomyces sp. LHD-70]MDQ8703296.1 hypothetical protein [Streptomyces sp. LHD-70]